MALRSTRASDLIRNHRYYDEDQWFVEAVGAEWFKDYVADGNMEKPFAIEGARWRASWAGMCARRIAYAVASQNERTGIVESDPPTAADAWRFKIGSMAHEEIQRIVEKLFPDSNVEMGVKIDEHGAGTIDLYVVRQDGVTFLIELKTVGATQWSTMFGDKGEGAKYQAITQAAVSAAALGDRQPDFIMVAYWTLEPTQEWRRNALGMPPSEFGRFSSQWTFSKEKYLVIAQEEIDRMERIVELVDTESYHAVPRVVPDPWKPRHEIVDPAGSQYRERNKDGLAKKLVKTWECNYCPYQSLCADITLQEQLEESQRVTEQAVQATIIAFPGATEVTDETPAD